MARSRNKGRLIPMDPALRRSRKPGRITNEPESTLSARYAPDIRGREFISPKRPERYRNKTTKKKTRRRTTESVAEYKRGMSISQNTTLIAGVFFIFVLVYLMRTLFAFLTTPEIPVDLVRMGTVDVPQVIEGIIIRDETVYTATREGIMQFYVNDYERVRPGTVVGSIQNLQAVAGIRQSITQIEERIMELQDIRGSISAADPAIQQINSQIKNMVDQRLSRHIALDMNEIFSLRDSITQNVNNRNQIIVSENLNADVSADIEIEYQMFMGQLEENMTPITVSRGGIITPVVDGFENLVTFENMNYLTREQTRQNVDFNQIIPQREVMEGDNIFKVVNNNRWFIAAYIENELIEGFTVGEHLPRQLFVEGRHEPLRVRVHRITPGFQESFVIFRVSEYIIDYLDTRSIFFTTTDTVQSGFRIANTAITEINHLAVPLGAIHPGIQRYVVRLIGEEEREIPVTITSQNDEYAFVIDEGEALLYLGNTLREYDNPGGTLMITDQQRKQGVFRVNHGIAQFVQINIPEDTQFGGMYTIIEPSLNPLIRAYNHIVTDAGMVSHGDIVFSGVR